MTPSKVHIATELAIMTIMTKHNSLRIVYIYSVEQRDSFKGAYSHRVHTMCYYGVLLLIPILQMNIKSPVIYMKPNKSFTVKR